MSFCTSPTPVPCSVLEQLPPADLNAARALLATQLAQDRHKIIVLDEGRIDAIDTHENLLENNAIYREVFHSQQKGVEE